MDDAHELRCTNAGLAAARAPLVMAWQDDMFVTARLARRRAAVHVPRARGHRHDEPQPRPRPLPARRADRHAGKTWSTGAACAAPSAPRRATGFGCRKSMPSSGRGSSAARASSASACSTRRSCRPSGTRPTSPTASAKPGGRVATCGYERLGGYEHLGSSTLGDLSDAYKARVLKNGLLFHERWAAVIARDHARTRRTWLRQTTSLGWIRALRTAAGRAVTRSS